MSQTTTTSASETLGFQAEVKQLLHLMIHSLYSNKEIFLRELVSNASDACDKLRFEAIDQPGLLEGDGELAIRVGYDKAARTITISDNGIGLSRDEAVANLGTIARSGTREFFSQLTGDKQKDAQLIGQFGVGFYSSFIVADKVTVLSRRAGLAANEAIRWESDGQGEFSIAPAEKAGRGTDVVLHLRADEDELLNGWKLREILRRYSDHISLPIRMAKEDWDAEKGEQVKGDELETVNQANALWTRNKSDITDEQYREFYKTVSHDYDDPLAWTHNRVEGRSEYTQLLYVPKHAPFDLWDRDARRGGEAVCEAGVHHGRRGAVAAVVSAFRARGDRFGGFAAERVARDPAGEPRCAGDPRGFGQAGAVAAGGHGGEQGGGLRDVLDGVRPGAEGRHGRGRGQPRAHRQAAALCVDARWRAGADGVVRGLCGPHEGWPGQDLLRDGGYVHGGGEQSAPGDFPEEGHRGAAAVGSGGRVDAVLSARVRRQVAGVGGQGRPGSGGVGGRRREEASVRGGRDVRRWSSACSRRWPSR